VDGTTPLLGAAEAVVGLDGLDALGAADAGADTEADGSAEEPGVGAPVGDALPPAEASPPAGCRPRKRATPTAVPSAMATTPSAGTSQRARRPLPAAPTWAAESSALESTLRVTAETPEVAPDCGVAGSGAGATPEGWEPTELDVHHGTPAPSVPGAVPG
jgi:hypothetical protein